MAENNQNITHSNIQIDENTNVFMNEEVIDINNNNNQDSYIYTQFSQTNNDDTTNATPKRQRVEDPIHLNEVSPLRITSSVNNSSSSIASSSIDTSTIENWISDRTRKIYKLKNSLFQKRKNPITYENHIKNFTFPNDLYVTTFKGYLQYPKSIAKLVGKIFLLKIKLVNYLVLLTGIFKKNCSCFS
jgi:hypothetical protein